jgi:hypothetical protein|tara:strand:+ start:320 stop:631 length:312 start_codon:yes stop_codon:yes gene_type:complete
MSRGFMAFVKAAVRDIGSTQLSLLRKRGPLKQFAPHRDGNRLVQAEASGRPLNALENGGDPLRVTNAVRAALQAGNMSDLTLAGGDEPYQEGINPVDPRPPDR